MVTERTAVPFTAEALATAVSEVVRGIDPHDARLIAHRLKLDLQPSPLPMGVYMVDESGTRIVSMADGFQYRYNVRESFLKQVPLEERWTGEHVGDGLTLLEEG